jgi:tetratricopeptide (TPR) repeat protein
MVGLAALLICAAQAKGGEKPKAADKPKAAPNAAAPAADAAPRDLRPAFGRDNAAFARGLFHEGFGELANEFCKAFDAWNEASDEERAAVRSVFLDVKLESARSISDVLKRKDELSSILKEKEAFVAKFKGTSEARAAEETLPDSYRLLGETLVAAMEKISDPEQVKALRDEGSKAFAHVQEALRKRKKEVEERLDDATLTDEKTAELREQRAVAWFNLGRTEYFRSQLFGKDDPERTRRLKESLKVFQDFALEFDDKTLCFQGYAFQGLCHKALGELDAAFEQFDAAIALREIYEQANGKYKVAPGVDDVVSWAVLQKTTTLAELGRHADAIAAVKDFFDHSVAPNDAQFGFALLAARADAELANGDAKSGAATATKLQELDPDGPWGARGREILAKTIGGGASGATASRKMGSTQLLKIADALVAKGSIAEAQRVCVRALDAAAGDADGSVDVLLMMGAIQGRQKDYAAAAVCFDTAWTLYPKASRAADAVYRALNCYQQLNAAEKKPWHAKDVESRRLKLANEYPTSSYAARIQLMQGEALEQDQKFSEAADFFLKVQPGTPNFEDAQYRGARCLVKEALRQAKAKQADAAKSTAQRAEEQTRKAITLLEASAEKTLDLQQKQTWRDEAFEGRTLLANVFMAEGVGRAGDVPKLFEGVDERYAAEPDKITASWSLRIQALNSLGKFSDAEKLLEALLAKSGDSRSAAAAAGVFARSCDARAVDLFEKDPKSKEGDENWKKAFRYYVISLKPKLKDAAAARSGELEQVAGRCFLMGKHFNGIPDRALSFAGASDAKIGSPDYFDQAEALYTASLEFVPSYRTRVSIARVQGFLGRFEDACDNYAKVFEQEHLIDDKGELDKTVANQRSDLVMAYLEWGVAELRAGTKGTSHDVDRLVRANNVFNAVVTYTKATGRDRSEAWWNARFWQIRSWVDGGDYTKASLALRDLERNTEDYDGGKYGLRELFRKMAIEVAGKLPK